MSLLDYLLLRHGELVRKNPSKPPVMMLPKGLLVIGQVPDVHPTK